MHNHTENNPGPLHGIRVLDFSRLLPGPYCTSLLAGMGAEVIKLEDVLNGDGMRSMPPMVDGTNPVFAALNAGKQSVSVDLKTHDGQAIAQDLVVSCDIVVEGFRPGVAARLGVDFASLAARNQHLVYCSISGYGQTGPFRDLPGHDLAYAAMAGLLDALFPEAPLAPGLPLADAGAALLASIQILAALHARDRGPQYCDVSLVDGARVLMPISLAEAGVPGGVPRLSELLQGSERTNVYRCADGGWLALTPLEDPFWERLHTALREEGELDGEPLTVDRQREIFLRRDRDQWFEILSAHDVPCAPVRRVQEMGNVAAPCRAPVLGEHTREWLIQLGYGARIEELCRAGVVRVLGAYRGR